MSDLDGYTAITPPGQMTFPAAPDAAPAAPAEPAHVIVGYGRELARGAADVLATYPAAERAWHAFCDDPNETTHVAVLRALEAQPMPKRVHSLMATIASALIGSRKQAVEDYDAARRRIERIPGFANLARQAMGSRGQHWADAGTDFAELAPRRAQGAPRPVTEPEPARDDEVVWVDSGVQPF